ncbi:MAG: helix-turn-helix domain-containing protein [Clostridia bacterium]|nr:helix-turn-helix domain-containing protein [Clostridia bacterium]
MISYEPFWKTLKEKKVSTYKLINEYDISGGTLNQMKNGKGITTSKIDDFCKILNCRVEDIIEYVED